MRYRYFDPLEQVLVEGDVIAGADVADLVGVVSGLREHCAPALEFTGGDGTSMVIGVDHDRAVVLWTTADGTTSHSIGGRGSGPATFDWFGEHTQMPGSYAVPLAAAVSAAGGLVDGNSTVPALLLAVD